MSNWNKTASDYQEQAAASSAAARKHLFSLIEGDELTHMRYPLSTESKANVACINQRDGRAFYAAARDAMAQ